MGIMHTAPVRAPRKRRPTHPPLRTHAPVEEGLAAIEDLLELGGVGEGTAVRQVDAQRAVDEEGLHLLVGQGAGGQVVHVRDAAVACWGQSGET